MNAIEKKNKTILEQLEQVEQMYQKIEKVINIEEFGYSETPEFKLFLQNIEINKNLQSK